MNNKKTSALYEDRHVFIISFFHMDTEHLIHKVRSLTGYIEEGFPCKRPVPFTMNRLNSLEYWDDLLVCEPPKGIKAFLYHGPEGLFWYGEDNTLKILKLENLPVLEGDGDITIMDAEWVPSERTFYVSDIPFLRGKKVTYFGLLQRLDFFKKRWLDFKKPSAKDQFYIKTKEYRNAKEFSNTDKLLFIKASGQQNYGTDTNLWEWVEPAKNTMFFRFNYSLVNGLYIFNIWALHAEVPDTEILYSEMPHLTCKAQPKFPSGTIFECKFEPKMTVVCPVTKQTFTGLWVPIKICPEKQRPDLARSAYPKQMVVTENITRDILRSRLSDFYIWRDSVTLP